MKRPSLSALALLLMTLMAGCGVRQIAVGGAPSRFVLRVALFPWIPDEASPSLAQRIESEFEQANPMVDLVLTIDRVGSEAYAVPDADVGKPSKGWWSLSPSAGGFHVAEVDAILLQELAERKVIRPWTSPPGRDDWHPAAIPATAVAGQIYGVPHWLCGYFVFSRDATVQAADTSKELAAALATLKKPALVADLSGNYTVTTLYLDAVADCYGPDQVQPALTKAASCPSTPPAPPCLDPVAVGDLKRVVQTCREGHGSNPCVEGGNFATCPELAARRFAQAEAGALIGYSERLNIIRSVQLENADQSRVLISSASLGNGSAPILFVDVFALHRDCDAICEQAARAFVTYMNEPSTHEWIQMHQDRLDVPPRYLLSGTKSAWDRLRTEPYFAELERLIHGATSFPNGGIADHRRTIRKSVEATWK